MSDANTDHPALAKPAEGEWGDIETAPTDGKKTEYRAADGSITEAYANPEFRPQSRALYTHWRRTPTPPSVDWARCQKCGGEIQGWICQQCHQEFEENDAGELVFCPSESVDWTVIGPKLVKAGLPFAELAKCLDDAYPDEMAPMFAPFNNCGQIRAFAAALAATQPQSNGD